MFDDNGESYADGLGVNKNYVCFFMGNSPSAQFVDGIRDVLVPQQFGPISDFSDGLYSLNSHRQLLPYTSVISNLSIPKGNLDGSAVIPVEPTEHHDYSLAPEIMGRTQQHENRVPMGDSCAVTFGKNIGAQVEFPYLGARVERMSSGEANRRKEIVVDNGNDESIQDIDVLHQKIFGIQTSSDSGESSNKKLVRELLNREILEQRDAVLKKVGKADHGIIESYLDGISGYLKELSQTAGASCQVLPNSASDGYEQRAELIMKLMTSALVCGKTSSAALMLSACRSLVDYNFVTSSGIYHAYPADIAAKLQSIRAPYHDLQHKDTGADARRQEFTAVVISWAVNMLMKFSDSLRQTPVGAGNLLDHTAILFSFESGYMRSGGGSGNRIDEIHSGENKTSILVSGLPEIKSGGNYIDAGKQHPAALKLKLFQLLGAPLQQFGQISGSFRGIT